MTRDYSRRVDLLEQWGTEQRRQSFLIEAAECGFLHDYLASGDMLRPRPGPAGPRPEAMALSEAATGEVTRLEPLTDDQFRAYLLPFCWDYLQWASGLFGLPGGQERFFDHVRTLLGRPAAPVPELVVLLERTDPWDLAALAKEF